MTRRDAEIQVTLEFRHTSVHTTMLDKSEAVSKFLSALRQSTKMWKRFHAERVSCTNTILIQHVRPANHIARSQPSHYRTKCYLFALERLRLSVRQEVTLQADKAQEPRITLRAL